jgi:hypothetical protein
LFRSTEEGRYTPPGTGQILAVLLEAGGTATIGPEFQNIVNSTLNNKQLPQQLKGPVFACAAIPKSL